MARASVNIKRLNGVSTSIFPDGAPAPDGALSYSGNPVHNSVITIVSDGSIDFGTNHPFLIQALYTDQLVGGTNFEVSGTTIEAGQQIASTSYNNAERLPVHNVAGLPYGVGIAMGDLRTPTGPNDEVTPTVNTTVQSLSNVYYDKVFKHEVGIYPAANQSALQAGAAATAQIKGSWDRWSTLNADTNVDVYSGVFNARAPFQDIALATSNYGFDDGGGGVINHTPGSYQSQMIDSTHLYTGVTMRQSYFKMSKTDGYVHSRMLIADQKTMHNYGKAVNLLPSITNTKADRHLFPAHVQRVDIALGMQYYISERVILGRSAARVEIADTPVPQTDHTASTGLTRRVAVAIPITGSRKVLKVKLREQVFAGESLNGKYLHIYDDNITVNHGFLGAILIDGAK